MASPLRLQSTKERSVRAMPWHLPPVHKGAFRSGDAMASPTSPQRSLPSGRCHGISHQSTKEPSVRAMHGADTGYQILEWLAITRRGDAMRRPEVVTVPQCLLYHRHFGLTPKKKSTLPGHKLAFRPSDAMDSLESDRFVDHAVSEVCSDAMKSDEPPRWTIRSSESTTAARFLTASSDRVAIPPQSMQSSLDCSVVRKAFSRYCFRQF
jgi:hypothetical protein